MGRWNLRKPNVHWKLVTWGHHLCSTESRSVQPTTCIKTSRILIIWYPWRLSTVTTNKQCCGCSEFSLISQINMILARIIHDKMCCSHFTDKLIASIIQLKRNTQAHLINTFFKSQWSPLSKKIHYQFGLTGVCGPRKINPQFLAWCTEQKKSV